jgi:hypothetical protein
VRATRLHVFVCLLTWSCSTADTSFEGCEDPECRGDWLVSTWATDADAAEQAVRSIVDPIERDAHVLRLSEEKAGETMHLCGLMSAPPVRTRCERLNNRPHLRTPKDEGRPPPDHQADAGEFADLPNPFEKTTGRDAVCAAGMEKHICQAERARHYARMRNDARAAASCTAIGELKWRSECFFSVSEISYSSQDPRIGFRPKRVDEGLRFCLGAGNFRAPCLTHLFNRTAQGAARLVAGEGNDWSPFITAADQLESLANGMDKEVTGAILDRYWSETLSGAYREQDDGPLPPEALRTGRPGHHLVSALAFERWQRREAESLETLQQELVEWLATPPALASTEAPPQEGAAPPVGSRSKPSEPQPPSARRVTRLAFTALPQEEAIEFGHYLANARRPVSTDRATDVALALLEAVARSRPVDHAFLAAGLVNDVPLVRWQAARLLQATKAPEALFREAGNDNDPMVRARIAEALGR